MEALRKFTTPIPLLKLAQDLKAGNLSPRSVAVTFDDGYVDNLMHAKPILEKHQIPATVFICTGHPGQEFWWDELDRLIMSSKTDLNSFRLQAGGKHFLWNRPDADSDTQVNIREKFRQELYNFLLDLDIEDQNHAMDVIRRWTGVSSDENAARALTTEEFRQLADGGLIEIGAHTRHHPMLPKLPLKQQRAEIVSSKQYLENLLDKPIYGFAYPNGKATDDAKKIVRAAGFKFACTSLHDVVRPGCDLYELTRFWQKDIDGDDFLKSLRLWMKGAQP
jgi:peptidoglycan/xylan/chitin deacetylase (PgdA/CDA1 family)